MDTAHIVLLTAILVVLLFQVWTFVLVQKTQSQVAEADGIVKNLRDDVLKAKTSVLQIYNEIVQSGLIPTPKHKF